MPRRYDGTDPDLPGGWIHEDGTKCPEYLAPDDGTRWWCSEHEKHLMRLGGDPTTTTQPSPRRDLATLRQQVQQARKDYSTEALGHYGSGELTAEAYANGRVKMCDEVLAMLAGTPAPGEGERDANGNG